MKVVYKNQTKKFKNSGVCTAIEYPLGDKDINGALIELSGRYPNIDRVVNLKCKELAYVINGSGKLVVGGKKVKLQKGDMVLIDAGEKYFWDGKMTIFTSCVPAWYLKQHKNVK